MALALKAKLKTKQKKDKKLNIYLCQLENLAHKINPSN